MDGIVICVCTRNRPRELTQLLKSIAASRTKPAHVLVSDDSDAEHRTKIAFICSSFVGVEYVEGPRRGLSANRNRCLRHLRGRTGPILFLDDDAVLHPTFLWAALGHLEQVEPGTIITGSERRGTATIHPANPSFWGHQEKRPRHRCDYECVVMNAAVFPSALFKQVSFDEHLRYGYDEVDVCAQARCLGYKIRFYPDLFNYHYSSPVNRAEYPRHLEASRLYSSFKRYCWLERDVGKAMAYAVLSPLHLLMSLAWRRKWRAFPMVIRTICSAGNMFGKECLRRRRHGSSPPQKD